MKKIRNINSIFKTAKTIDDLIRHLSELPDEVRKGELIIETKTVTTSNSGRSIRWKEGGIMDRIRFRVRYDDDKAMSLSRKISKGKKMLDLRNKTINNMFGACGVRGMCGKCAGTINILSFDTVGKVNNRKYDIPAAMLEESFRERRKYKKLFDIESPVIEETVNGLDDVKAVEPPLYALFKEIVLHIKQDDSIETYRKSIMEYVSSDRDAIVARFKNMKENNSYIMYDIRRSLSVLTNRHMESFDLKLVENDDVFLYYLIVDKDGIILGNVVLSIRPVMETDIKHKSDSESNDVETKRKIGKLVEWVDYNHTYMSWDGILDYLRDKNIPYSKYSLCDEDEGKYGEEIKIAVDDIDKETLLRMWKDMGLDGDPDNLDYIIFYQED